MVRKGKPEGCELSMSQRVKIPSYLPNSAVIAEVAKIADMIQI
jgi:hypothetical protein